MAHELDRKALLTVQDKLNAELPKLANTAEAAQLFCSAAWERWSKDLALVRLYVTTPYATLPPFQKAFVDKLVKGAGAAPPSATTPVLSLLGTRGAEQAWNDRATSQGHVSIPLLSSKFVSGIPMILRMLQQLKAGVDWLDSEDLKQVEATASRLSGLFYVPDAATETDREGRKVVPAQDFVARHGVKTVFGIAGGYPSGHIAVAIFFTRHTLAEGECQPMKSLINTFKAATVSHVMGKRIFPN